MKYFARNDLSDLVGKRVISIAGLTEGSDQVKIFTGCGREYLFYHSQECCETVSLNDFDGCPDDLAGGLILSAEAVTNGDEEPPFPDSWTWTFYKIETDKGGLWMRWLGESNGYYSEGVDFALVSEPEGAGENSND